MDCSHVNYLWIIVMFLSDVWTLVLTAPIHSRGLASKSCDAISPNLFWWRNNLILRWPEGELSFTQFYFLAFKECILRGKDCSFTVVWPPSAERRPPGQTDGAIQSQRNKEKREKTVIRTPAWNDHAFIPHIFLYTAFLSWSLAFCCTSLSIFGTSAEAEAINIWEWCFCHAWTQRTRSEARLQNPVSTYDALKCIMGRQLTGRCLYSLLGTITAVHQFIWNSDTTDPPFSVP